MNSPKEKINSTIFENQKRFLNFIKGKVGDESIAEEILQQSLLKAVKSADQIQDTEKFVSWFYSIIRNSISDHYRKANQMSELPENLESEEIGLDEKKSICECIEGILDNLKDEYSEVIRRLDLNEENTTDVASELKISLDNLKVRKHRARKKLKEQLELICRTCSKHGCLDCGCKR